jgi:hypothetical protein
MSLFNELIQKVAAATDRNDHTQSIIYVAFYFGMCEEVEELDDILRRQMEIGHMPDILYARRHAIYQSVMETARDFLTDKQYETLYQAF